LKPAGQLKRRPPHYLCALRGPYSR
jgi:hypothetical protein